MRYGAFYEVSFKTENRTVFKRISNGQVGDRVNGTWRMWQGSFVRHFESSALQRESAASPKLGLTSGKCSCFWPHCPRNQEALADRTGNAHRCQSHTICGCTGARSLQFGRRRSWIPSGICCLFFPAQVQKYIQVIIDIFMYYMRNMSRLLTGQCTPET